MLPITLKFLYTNVTKFQLWKTRIISIFSDISVLISVLTEICMYSVH